MQFGLDKAILDTKLRIVEGEGWREGGGIKNVFTSHDQP